VFTIWAVIRWLHLLSAFAWIGGMIFLAVVLTPVLRTSLAPTERALIFAKVGRRYALMSWVALTILVITGIFNAKRRAVDWWHLTDYEYGRRLHLKLEFVGVVIVLTLIHAFYFGPKLERIAMQVSALDGPDPALERERRKLQIISGVISVANLAMNIFIVLVAASLIA
jgi:uncharacterized membrane protein